MVRHIINDCSYELMKNVERSNSLVSLMYDTPPRADPHDVDVAEELTDDYL